jgi:cobyrinic acid a,c-diamide synthase
MVLSFIRHSNTNGIAVIEGNRGLFDGMDVRGVHSTAELAKKIGSPVILIIDSTKASRTLAAMVLGCLKMDPELYIAGVILNMVGTSRQELLARTAVEEHCGVPVVGAVPRIRDNSLLERHMGLVPPFEHPKADRSLAAATDMVRKFVNLDDILNIAKKACPLNVPCRVDEHASSSAFRPLRIGVVRDKSFWFYYPENIEALMSLGASIVEINSMVDRVLPEIDALYIGGGFPETHAPALAANKPFRVALQESIQNGLPLYAECGGLMYLGKSLILNGSEYPMVNTFPVSFTVEQRPQGHGYTELQVTTDNPFFTKGTVVRGHEFHYSRPIPSELERLRMIFKNIRGSGFMEKRDGLFFMNALACYSHIHAAGESTWGPALLNLAENHSFLRAHVDIVHSVPDRSFEKDWPYESGP